MAGKNYYGPSFVCPEFRLSFPHLFQPEAFGQSEPKYSIQMVMTPENMRVIRKQLKDAAIGKWGPDVKKWPATLRKIDFMADCSANGKDGWPVRDGDDHADQRDGYAGMQYVKASSKKAPGVVDAKRQPILDAETAHAGVICRARLQAWAWERPDGAGVSLSLEHVLVARDDGTNWGGGSRVRAEDAFAEVIDEYDDGADNPANYDTASNDL